MQSIAEDHSQTADDPYILVDFTAPRDLLHTLRLSD
jgi:hypothetical protein